MSWVRFSLAQGLQLGCALVYACCVSTGQTRIGRDDTRPPLPAVAAGTGRPPLIPRGRWYRLPSLDPRP